jgi:hypothetical protein
MMRVIRQLAGLGMAAQHGRLFQFRADGSVTCFELRAQTVYLPMPR